MLTGKETKSDLIINSIINIEYNKGFQILWYKLSIKIATKSHQAIHFPCEVGMKMQVSSTLNLNGLMD